MLYGLLTYKVHVTVFHRRIEHHLARVEHRHHAGRMCTVIVRTVIRSCTRAVARRGASSCRGASRGVRRGASRGVDVAVPLAKVVVERGGELCGARCQCTCVSIQVQCEGVSVECSVWSDVPVWRCQCAGGVQVQCAGSVCRCSVVFFECGVAVTCSVSI